MIKNTLSGVLIQDNLNRIVIECSKLKNVVTNMQDIINRIEGTQVKKREVIKHNVQVDNEELEKLGTLCRRVKNLAEEQNRILNMVKLDL